MSSKDNARYISNKKGLLYSAEQTPPPSSLFFSSLQHMLLVLSLGMALPVSIARTAGLDLIQSGSLMAAALFSMGLTGILQTIKTRFVGSGYQSLSVSDSAALSACLLAAQIGGVPLVLTMTIFSGIVKGILGSFTFKLRKLFPPEVTGTMIFILGINTIPTGLKYFLGSAQAGVYDPTHLLVAVITLIFMLACTLFIKPIKPYTALAGIVFGFIVSAISGIFKFSSFSALSNQSFVALPIYSDLAFSFDTKVIIPFLIVTIAAVVDNIGDYSSCQSANDPNYKKPNWKSIEGGIRGSAIGTAFAGLIGGAIQSTATTNIGIAKASGITSRKVAYLAGIMLMVVSFFPTLTGAMSMIPEPVLGAVLMYSICYIMAGGFSALSSRAMDDKRIFVVFLSICFAISTLIPNLYSFLPQNIAQVIVSPMVMGVGVLLITTLLGKIGTKKKIEFVTGVGSDDVIALDKEIEKVCQLWCTDRNLMSKLQIGLNALCEGFYECNPDTKLQFIIKYDQLQIKIDIKADNVYLTDDIYDMESGFSTLGIAISMVRNMFDSVKVMKSDHGIMMHVDADIE